VLAGVNRCAFPFSSCGRLGQANVPAAMLCVDAMVLVSQATPADCRAAAELRKEAADRYRPQAVRLLLIAQMRLTSSTATSTSTVFRRPIIYSGPSFPTSSVRIQLVSTSVSSLRRSAIRATGCCVTSRGRRGSGSGSCSRSTAPTAARRSGRLPARGGRRFCPAAHLPARIGSHAGSTSRCTEVPAGSGCRRTSGTSRR
jgi:hypothetical protein